MMFNNRLKKLLLPAFVVLLGLFFAIYAATRPAVSGGIKSITVEVVHSDESCRTVTYRTDAEYLGELLLEEGLIIGSEGTYGLYITEVDGERAIFEEDYAYWALYENGGYAQLGIDQTPIDDGDSFRLVYTIG